MIGLGGVLKGAVMSESGIFSVGKVEVEGLGIHVRYRVRNFDPFEDTKPLLLVADDQEVVAGTTQEHNRPESEVCRHHTFPDKD